MNELTKTNQNLAKKEAIGQYVHDMLDLEIRAFSLRKMAEEARTKLKREDALLEQELQKAKDDNERACQDYNYANAEKEKQKFIPTLFSVLGDFWSGFGLFIGLLLPLFFLLSGIIIALTPESDKMYLFVLVALGIFIIEALIATPFAMDKLSDYSEIQKKEMSFKYAEDHLIEVQKRYNEFHLVCAKKLRGSITDFENSISKIEHSLQKNYALNIVPPDYRRLQCLVWIDYAFRNDQVDTMREATLQCDKWVRHIEIEKAMTVLAEEIRGIAVLWEETNANIAQMNQEIYSISKSQKAQLSESKSARYAMESVQKSTEKLAQYEEMKRWGSF